MKLKNITCCALVLVLPLIVAGCGTTKTLSAVKTVTSSATSPSDADSTGNDDPSALGDDATATATTGKKKSKDAKVDPCALLTKTEAQTLSGMQMLDGDSVKGQSCSYGTDPNGPTSQVDVYIDAGAKQTYSLDKSLGHTFVTLTGIGDASYQETGAAFARKGTRWLQVSDPFLEDAPGDAARLKAALTLAASRFFADGS